MNPWLKGLLLAMLGGVITSFVGLQVAPDSFNFSGAGLKKLALIFAAGVLVAVKNYLIQSPLPASNPTPVAPAQKGFARMGSVFASAGALLGILVLCACLTASQFTQYLNAIAPAVSIVLQIVATARGVPYNAAPAAKISGDVSNVEKVYADWQAAKAADKPGVVSVLNSSFAVLQSDLQNVFAVAQVSDGKVQPKIASLITYVFDGVQLAESFVPQPAPPTARQAPVANLKAKDLKASFNRVLRAKTGNAAVDQLAGKLKL